MKNERPDPKVAVIIPARYASTRFPGKMLARDPSGKVLVQHVHEAATRAKRVARVIVATDDARIRDAVTAFGGQAVMTSPKHTCGSERIAEVAETLDADIVVNVQGDEPQIRPEMIDQVVQALVEDLDCPVSTLANPIANEKEFLDPNVVKVVLDERGRALYFSRSPIPFVRDAAAPVVESPVAVLRHLGIYGYRREFLLEYAAWPPCPLERAEKLEQLRILFRGHHIKVGVTQFHSIGIDTPEDFEVFCKTMTART